MQFDEVLYIKNLLVVVRARCNCIFLCHKSIPKKEILCEIEHVIYHCNSFSTNQFCGSDSVIYLNILHHLFADTKFHKNSCNPACYKGIKFLITLFTPRKYIHILFLTVLLNEIFMHICMWS